MATVYLIPGVCVGVILLSFLGCMLLSHVSNSQYWRHPHAVSDTVKVIAIVLFVPLVFCAAAVVPFINGALKEESAMLIYVLGTLVSLRFVVRFTSFLFRNRPESVMNNSRYKRNLLLPLTLLVMMGAMMAFFLFF